MKDSKLLLYLLPIAAILFWYLGRPPAPPSDIPAPTAPPPVVMPAAPPSGESTAKPAVPPAIVPPATEAGHPSVPPVIVDALPATESTATIGTIVPPEAPAPVLEPEQKMEALRVNIRTFGQRFRGNPVGNNAEITAALGGKNPGGVNFLATRENSVNEAGELCDGWGTPYFFHQLSGTETEIRSAGPDKKMWTSDDLVTK